MDILTITMGLMFGVAAFVIHKIARGESHIFTFLTALFAGLSVIGIVLGVIRLI